MPFDEMSFEDLIGLHNDMLWRIALAHERNAAVAEELYQDICLALWQSRKRIGAADNPKAYSARIANNVAISHVRRELRRGDTVDERGASAGAAAEGVDVDDAIDRLERQERLMRAVRQLPLNWRLPITLTLEGFKPQEIAYVTGSNANTVSLRLGRAKKALRASLGEQENGHD